MIIGISGGISSGKNLISNIFLKYNSVIFDADNNVKNILNHNKSAISEIKELFPTTYFNGVINRLELRNIIFSCEKSFHKNIKILEQIIHPIIRDEYKKFISNNISKKNIILNIPLLIENNYYKYDKLITINCAKDIRKKRFLLRTKNDLFHSKMFELLNSIQISDDERLLNSKNIIHNNKSIFNAISSTKKLAQKMLT
jgi:dephospho-CoA kinase